MTSLCILCLSNLLPGYFLFYLVNIPLTGQHVHLACISLPLVATQNKDNTGLTYVAKFSIYPDF